MEQVDPQEKDFKLYGTFMGIFVTVLVISGATLVFPITLIFNDILTEVYGYRRSRRIIWTGMGCQIFAAFMFFLVGIWPAAPFWNNQEAYNIILGTAPRIFLASLTAYFFSEFTNSLVLSRMKYRHQGKRGIYQSWRFVASTIAAETVDSIFFILIAFAGVLPVKNLLETMVTITVAKILYEIIALPFSIKFAGWVKNVEGIDKIDDPHHTNYNPFGFLFLKKTRL